MTFPEEIDLEVAELLGEEAPSASDTYETANRAHQLAKQLATAGRIDDAVTLYRRAIAIKQRVLGPGDPEVVTTLHNLAVLLKAAGRADEAETLWAEARAVLNT